MGEFRNLKDYTALNRFTSISNFKNHKFDLTVIVRLDDDGAKEENSEDG